MFWTASRTRVSRSSRRCGRHCRTCARATRITWRSLSAAVAASATLWGVCTRTQPCCSRLSSHRFEETPFRSPTSNTTAFTGLQFICFSADGRPISNAPALVLSLPRQYSRGRVRFGGGLRAGFGRDVAGLLRSLLQTIRSSWWVARSPWHSGRPVQTRVQVIRSRFRTWVTFFLPLKLSCTSLGSWRRRRCRFFRAVQWERCCVAPSLQWVCSIKKRARLWRDSCVISWEQPDNAIERFVI